MSWGFASPDLNLRRTKVVQWLPFDQVIAVQEWVPSLSLELTPDDYLRQLRERFPKQESVAWVFYASWLYLDRLDQVQGGYDDRVQALNQSEKLLRDYELRCSRALRVDNQPGRPQELKLTPVSSQPKNIQDAEALTVFRRLPWPEQGVHREQVFQLLEACREDLKQVEIQRNKIDSAKATFVARQDLWMTWLLELAHSTRRFTQSQYLAPYSPPDPKDP